MRGFINARRDALPRRTRLALCALLAPLFLLIASQSLAVPHTAARGLLDYTDWPGPPLAVHYYVPATATADSRVLLVIPGARRNAGEYLDQWVDLADDRGFVVASIGADLERFPTEYDYNAGRVMTPEGQIRPEDEWLFSAIDPVFLLLRSQLGLTRERYSLYGHSAGGGFVLLFTLFKPDALVNSAVAANPAFVTLPNRDDPFPFGLANVPVQDAQIARWLAAPLTIMLGDQDLDPRTKPLSNSPIARRQGPNVFIRGQLVYREAKAFAVAHASHFNWILRIVEGVGHDSALIAPHAPDILFEAGQQAP